MDNKAKPFKEQCSDSELAFCHNYVITLSKTRAAEAMGTESERPGVIGWQVYQRPHVQGYIKELLSDCALSAEETTKLVSKNAAHDMGEFFSPVQKLYTPRIKVGLQTLIDRLDAEIDFEDTYRSRAEMTNEANDAWFQRQEGRRDAKLRYEIELEMNPDAWRIIDGETELRTEMELDINKLIEAQERGQIKSVKYDKDGRIQIEGYDALAAQDKLLRMHGKFEKDNEQSKPTVTIPAINVYNSAPPLANSEGQIDV